MIGEECIIVLCWLWLINYLSIHLLIIMVVTPHHKITDCYQESCWRILDKVRIHKYTHINHKLSMLNLKYYNFGSNFDTKINIDVEVIYSMMQGHHIALWYRPQKRSMPTRSTSTGFNRPASGPPTGNHPQHHRKGVKNYLHTVRSIRKSLNN
jgi:hypothetical protein